MYWVRTVDLRGKGSLGGSGGMNTARAGEPY